MQRFGPATREWFAANFAAPTRVQREGWPVIAGGEHALLVAPTGTGKTLAAFLWAIDRLMTGGDDRSGTRVVYVSPLKALAHDIDRNLRAPLEGIAARAAGARVPRVALRTGDTSAAERRRQLREPAEILVTTPESLYLLLTSSAREGLRNVDTIIVDEVHALAPSKRGAHLALSLERLCALAGEPQRIGLSATARPLPEIARWLGGDRPVRIVDAAEAPALDLQIIVPVADMTKPAEGRPLDDERPGDKGIWPTIHPRLLDLIRAHRTTIVFVNSRGLCERLARRLNELAGAELCRAHHGSLAQAERRDIEAALAAGKIAAIVATSSLELGIDMEAVDLVVLVESPASTASGLQRVGRAGHGVGRTSIGRIFPKHRGDLLEATVVAERMRAGRVEAIEAPANPLDVLAQQVVAMVAADPWPVDQLAARVRRAAPFSALPDSALLELLDMLSGRYPSTAFAELAPRLVWDRERDLLTPRRGARLIALVSGGTIPDRGTYPVVLGEGGPRVGELDEEMVHETLPGQTFALGATTWRVQRITRDRVIVTPAPGESGKLPFWRGDGPGRPIELGRDIGAFTRELGGLDDAAARARLAAGGLDPLAAHNLVALLAEQRAATGTLPTDQAITVERFRDEIGDWRVCILTPFGARVHAPWAIALEGRLLAETGTPVQTMWSDDGIVLRFADADQLPEPDALLLDADEVDERLLERLGATSLFAAAFRENAARALLLPRRRPGERTPLWLQRLRSQQLLAVAQQYPAFPIIVETYRTCLRDVFDVPALRALMADVRAGVITVDAVETAGASPMARTLMFDYVAAYLYEGDLPVAERRAQALALDRQMLRELLGDEELRDLLDPQAVAEVAAELQGTDAERRARDADELHDLLRRIGDLDDAELAARTEGDAAALIAQLLTSGRALRAGDRWIAAEDAALYRDALGITLPPGLPDRLLAPIASALDQLLLRHARSHPPFTAADVAARHGIGAATVHAHLAAMAARGELVRGGGPDEYCHPEVLRRMKRRSLARLRSEVAPVEAPALGRFLVAWHGAGPFDPLRSGPRRGRARLEEV
ncbi:MAG TPA: DEAD/DEAH box helicase, partial [Kofleriaceae bacterium]|nr:DEAD/DEAH box helicase [Kofleriaceae bacterium]